MKSKLSLKIVHNAHDKLKEKGNNIQEVNKAKDQSILSNILHQMEQTIESNESQLEINQESAYQNFKKVSLMELSDQFVAYQE